MAPVTRESFRERLSSLSPGALAAFVSAVWDERGREPRLTGQRIVVRRPDTGSAEETLYVLPADRDVETAPSTGIDVLVAARPLPNEVVRADAVPADVRVIDADELWRIVRYAVDRDSAARLLSDHLGYRSPRFPVRNVRGRPPNGDLDGEGARDGGRRRRNERASAIWDGPDGDRAAGADDEQQAGRPVETWPSPGRRSALVGGLLLLGAGAVGLQSAGIGGVATTLAGESTTGDRPAGDGTFDPASHTSSGSVARHVPGVTAEGAIDPQVLADAHVARLQGTSYTLVAERRVLGDDGSLRSSLAVEVTLAGDRSFLAAAETAGPHAPRFLGSPPARGTFWSDGETYVRRFSRDGETTYNEFEPPGNHAGTWRYWVHTVPFGGRDGSARAFVATLFENVRARFVGATSADRRNVYRFRVDGARPDAGGFRFAADVDAVEDVDADALVDEDGYLRSLDLSYAGRHGGTPARVRRSVRYQDVGATRVERPDWYPRAVGTSTADR